jgi:hypothetical protein
VAGERDKSRKFTEGEWEMGWQGWEFAPNSIRDELL